MFEQKIWFQLVTQEEETRVIMIHINNIKKFKL